MEIGANAVMICMRKRIDIVNCNCMLPKVVNFCSRQQMKTRRKVFIIEKSNAAEFIEEGRN